MTDSARPARWWTASTRAATVLVGFVCSVVLWTFLPPVVAFPYFALASTVLLALGVVWSVLFLIGWFKYRTLRPSAIAPALVLLTVALVASSAPPRLAFAV